MFALAASQESNFGNSANWFFSYRGGYYGVMSRLYGVGHHSVSLHNWRTPLASFATHEHDVTTILFCMDSAIECFVYMLNALGQAVDKSGFRDISSNKALRRIGPDDILGTKKSELSGYGRVFPGLRSYWHQEVDLLRLIFENHDVTKHRHRALSGGKVRLDPPPGFYERLGYPNDLATLTVYGLTPPMEFVNIPRHPKLPTEQRSADKSEWVTLESVEADFNRFVSESFHLALQDARETITLKNPTSRP